MKDQTSNSTIRLGVSRHLQDFNGYCGPACAMMLVDFTGSAKSPPVFAQNELFREVRQHASAAQDRRPMKSPAESLLALINDHTAGTTKWEKVYHSEPIHVAKKIIRSITEKAKPCLLLVSKGMHWVVAFGVQRKADGTPAGILMRDPAWAGMPRFFGISIFPDTPAIDHTPTTTCKCLELSPENPPGTVHERYIAIEELLSTRGLQGSRDWEGLGAIALIAKDNLIQKKHAAEQS